MRKFDLQKALFILPNLFTMSSIFCGFFSMIESTTDPTPASFYRSALLIVFAMFFDIVDGRVARMTRTQSAFGVQIDSLADVGSFGAAPALLVYRWSLHSYGMFGVFVCFVFFACGAIRLARFNVLSSSPSGTPKKPSKYILGLPIPGAAGVLVSLVVANYAVTGNLHTEPTIMVVVMLLLSFFMVSTIQFRSFKDVKLTKTTAVLVFGTVTGAAIIAKVLHPSFALVALLVGYLAIGVLESLARMVRPKSGDTAKNDTAKSDAAKLDAPGSEKLRSGDEPSLPSAESK